MFRLMIVYIGLAVLLLFRQHATTSTFAAINDYSKTPLFSYASHGKNIPEYSSGNSYAKNLGNVIDEYDIQDRHVELPFPVYYLDQGADEHLQTMKVISIFSILSQFRSNSVLCQRWLIDHTFRRHDAECDDSLNEIKIAQQVCQVLSQSYLQQWLNGVSRSSFFLLPQSCPLGFRPPLLI